MKSFNTTLIVWALLCFVSYANAQTETGNILIGGESGLDFSSSKAKWKVDGQTGDPVNSTSIEFSPHLGVFIADGLALGASLPISHTSEKDDEDSYSSTSVIFAPFLKYYFGPSNVKPYVQSQVGFGSVKTKMDMGSPSEVFTAGVFAWELSAGVGIFLNESVSFDMGIGYASASSKPKEDNPGDARNVSSGLGIGIGFFFAL